MEIANLFMKNFSAFRKYSGQNYHLSWIHLWKFYYKYSSVLSIGMVVLGSYYL